MADRFPPENNFLRTIIPKVNLPHRQAAWERTNAYTEGENYCQEKNRGQCPNWTKNDENKFLKKFELVENWVTELNNPAPNQKSVTKLATLTTLALPSGVSPLIKAPAFSSPREANFCVLPICLFLNRAQNRNRHLTRRQFRNIIFY